MELCAARVTELPRSKIGRGEPLDLVRDMAAFVVAIQPCFLTRTVSGDFLSSGWKTHATRAISAIFLPWIAQRPIPEEKQI